MGIQKIYNKITGQWEPVTTSSGIQIDDISNSFEANDLEGALQEVVKWNVENSNNLDLLNKTVDEHSDKIEYLLVNGGGGGGGAGGSVLPNLTSTLTGDIVVPKGREIKLPLFFSSPNMGNGTLIVIVNNKQVDSITMKQGSTEVNIGALVELRNTLKVYIKDRAGLLSNELSWTVINGGIGLRLDFDYLVDYVTGRDILMRYNIDTEEKQSQLEVTVDGVITKQSCKVGYNEFYFTNLAPGVHSVSVKATSGNFISEVYNFNLVVINSESLYTSSQFNNGSQLLYGVPITIPYRVSYKDSSIINVKFYINDQYLTGKDQNVKSGSYALTLGSLNVGDYTYKIEATLNDKISSVQGSFSVIESDYNMVLVNEGALRYRLNPIGRNNQSEDKEVFEYSDGMSTITTRLYGCNFSSNGWVDNVLRLDGGAYGIIDYSPWGENAEQGSTIEVVFKSTDIGKPNTKVLEYKDKNSNKGLYIGLEEVYMGVDIKLNNAPLYPGEKTTVSFVVDRKNKFCKVFINGICTRAFVLSDSGSGTSAIYENLSFSNGKVYINANNNEEEQGVVDIYDIRIYDRALTDEELVKNFLALETDPSKQKELYDFMFNNNSLPTMRIYGDETDMNNINKKTMRIEYQSPNTEKYGQPFQLSRCLMYWQGTSSISYVRKNYNIELYDEQGEKYYYTPYPNSVEEYIFCLKCDYMESSHARNIGIARLVETYFYNEKNPAQKKDARVRNTINGFPILLYINDNFMGVYNFNTDRYSAASFGYQGDNCLVYEISANTDTTAGAFYKYEEENSSNINEDEYYKRDFMCLYPPTRAAGNDNFAEIKRLVEYVSDTSAIDFGNSDSRLDEYFNREYLLKYVIFAYLFGAVDSLGKNMKLATWDGRIWYPQIYDADTTLGLDNTGLLKFGPGIEIGDPKTYNTTTSKLWQNILQSPDLMTQVRAIYKDMRMNGGLRLDNILECIVEEQIDKIPATYYNMDMQTKYLETNIIYALHGSDKEHIKLWLEERLLYMDTLLDYEESSLADFIQLRCSANTQQVYLDIETFKTMYLKIKWRNQNTGSDSDESMQKLKVVKNGGSQRFSFTTTSATGFTDQEVFVYGSTYIKSLGDLTNLQPSNIILNNANKINNLECHSPNTISIAMDSCRNLQRVDLSGCTNLGTNPTTTSLNVSLCSELKYVDIRQTQLMGIITNTLGCNIKEIWYPKTIQRIEMINCPQLHTIGLQPGHSCNELRLINCPNIQNFGDRMWSNSYNKYLLSNGYYLSGVKNIYFDNSYLSFDSFEVQFPIGLISIILKNMPNVKNIKFGMNISEDFGINNFIELLESSEDLNIEVINCPNLLNLYVTGLGRKSSIEGENYSTSSNCYPAAINCYLYGTYSSTKLQTCFRKKILDISKTKIENVYLYAATQLKALNLPISIKNMICNKLLDVKDSFKGSSFSTTNLSNFYLEYENITRNPFSRVFGILGTGNQFSLNSTYHNDGFLAPMLVCNVWCSITNSEFIPTLENPTWDLFGLEFSDLHYTGRWSVGANFYITELIQSSLPIFRFNLTNASYKPIKYGLSLKLFKNISNCSIDYNEYSGESLVSAFENLNDDNNNIINFQNVDFNNILILTNIIKNINTQYIGWDFVEKLIPCIKSINELAYTFQNCILREQNNFDEDGINIISDIVDTYSYGEPWFRNSNLKYVKNFTIKGGYAGWCFTESNIERIGDIYIGKGATNTEYFGITSMFYKCVSLLEVGNITLDLNNNIPNTIGYGLKDAFNGCINLKKIGSIKSVNLQDIRINIQNAFVKCNSIIDDIDLSQLNVGNAQGAFQYVKANRVILNAENISTLEMAFQYSNIETIELLNLNSNTLLTTMKRMFYNANIDSIIGLEIPSNVTILQEIFNSSTINDPNYVFPEIPSNSICKILTGAFGYSNIRLNENFIVPPLVTNLEIAFTGNSSIPENFILDCSNVETILNNRQVFKDSNVKNIIWKLPRYIWYDSVNNESNKINRSLDFFRGCKSLTCVTFDFSNYLGDDIGVQNMLHSVTGNIILYGLNFNKMTGDFGGYGYKFLTDFSFYEKTNLNGINMRYFNMTYENRVKFIDEGLDNLDCANLISRLDNDLQNISTVPCEQLIKKYNSSYGHTYILYISEEAANIVGKSTKIQIILLNDEFQDQHTMLVGTISDIRTNYPDGKVIPYNNGLGTLSYPYFRIKFVGISCSIEELQRQILLDNISYKLPDNKVTQTPKTLTMNRKTDSIGNNLLSEEQKENLILQATPKGWNVVFV